MKIDKNIINQLILNNLNELLEDINKIYKLDDKYLIKFELEDSSKYIEEINNNFSLHKNIFQKEEEDNYVLLDEFFNNNDILLIDNISLSNIWKNTTNIKNKKTIHQYIKVFYTILEINDGKDESENIDFFLNQFQKIFNNDNDNKEAEEVIKNSLEKVSNVNSGEMQDLCKNLEEQIENNKDNSIFKLAQEMSSELMTENLDLNQLLNGNNNNLMNVISNIGNKLQQKFESNDINQEDLMNDMNKFINDNNGIFKNVMDNFNNEINNEKILKKKEKKEKKEKKGKKNKKKKQNN